MIIKRIIAALFIIFLSVSIASAGINDKGVKMDTQKTIRLLYPQWQGGNIGSFVPELQPDDASTGYILGSELLNFLAPETKNKTVKIPVTDDLNRVEENGIMGYKPILEQTKNVVKIINKENPDKIVVLGGECSVSVVPFTYLAKKYNNDVAVIWIDAHPDITLPDDKTYNGYHAMAVTAIMGKGDKEIVLALPANISPDKILFVGLRDWERQQIKDRQIEYGMKHLTSEEVSQNSDKIIEWIKQTEAKHILIHFDMDVLDPNEIIAAVGVVPNGMKIAEVVRVINDINNNFDVVGLTVAEPMPRTAIRLKKMLNQLPMMK
ncbi:arginase family protein [bacterium]|nr:arginase family protein [bacterium]